MASIQITPPIPLLGTKQPVLKNLKTPVKMCQNSVPLFQVGNFPSQLRGVFPSQVRVFPSQFRDFPLQLLSPELWEKNTSTFSCGRLCTKGRKETNSYRAVLGLLLGKSDLKKSTHQETPHG